MPKNTKKRTKIKDLPRSKQELSSKAAKKIKGGVENPTICARVQQVKKGGIGSKGGFTLGQLPGGLQ